MRTQRTYRDEVEVQLVSLAIVLLVGMLLALISTLTIIIGAVIRVIREQFMEQAFSSGVAGEGYPWSIAFMRAYLVYAGFGITLLLIAAVLTAYAPAAAGSGLPQVKAFLNGCHIPGILQPSTVIVKAVGAALVVTSGLPIGREGPMVHIGAALAASISRLRFPFTNRQLIYELRSPAAQRNWVGVGAAAGVAAAFNAPLGGILYSLEEVCSHWSSRMTWLSFLASVTVVACGNVLHDGSNGIISVESLVVSLVDDTSTFRASFSEGDFLWVVLLGAGGGLIGAIYNLIAFRLSSLRARWLTPCKRSRLIKVVEVFILGLVLLSISFWVPALAECTPCPPEIALCSAPDLSGSGSQSDIGLHLHGLHLRRYACAAGEYSELATLMHAGQEELVRHLIARDRPSLPSISALCIFMPLYFFMAVLDLGLAVPAGNFIPSLTIGATFGRLVGTLIAGAGLAEDADIGRYALIGAAATLGGVTRMTITVAVILSEVSDDAAIMPACMLALAVARVVGNLLSPSFDHGMISESRSPFLHEFPPQVFEVLTAKDVMAVTPVCLIEVPTVRDVVHALQSTNHNGFPVLSGSCLTMQSSANESTCLSGLILRRQLLVLLHERVWESQLRGEKLKDAVKERFITSFFVMSQMEIRTEVTRLHMKLTDDELSMPIDLRSFYDPAPFTVGILAPLSRVYRLFNEIGVRHIPVLDSRQQLSGIITRKDVQPETISLWLSADEVHNWAASVHSYWRTLLFGSSILSHTDQSNNADKPDSTNRRFSTSSAAVQSSMLSSSLPSPVMSRRCVSQEHEDIRDTRRSSLAQSLAILRLSSQGPTATHMQGVAASCSTTPRSDEEKQQGTVDGRPPSPLGSDAPAARSSKSQSQHASLRSSRTLGKSANYEIIGCAAVGTSHGHREAHEPLENAADSKVSCRSQGNSLRGSKQSSAALNNNDSRSILRSSASSLLLSAADLHDGRLEGSEHRTSEQPSLRATLIAARSCICRSGPHAGFPSLSVNSGSCSVASSAATNSESSFKLRAYSAGARQSTVHLNSSVLPMTVHLWQVASRRMIERRVSAPATLLTDHFKELHTLSEELVCDDA